MTQADVVYVADRACIAIHMFSFELLIGCAGYLVQLLLYNSYGGLDLIDSLLSWMLCATVCSSYVQPIQCEDHH